MYCALGQALLQMVGASAGLTFAIAVPDKRMLDQKPGKNGADPWVVALALDRDATVVTEERPSGGLKSPKIPDVCRAEKVACMDVLEFIKNEKWKW